MINSKRIFSFLISFILGIGISSYLSIPFFIYLFFFVGLIFLSLVLSKTDLKKFLLIIFCLLGFFLGAWRFNLSRPKINDDRLAFYHNKEIVWQGKIVKEPEERLDKINLTVKAEKLISPTEKEISGKALISVPLYSDYHYGDYLEIKSKLIRPEEYKNYRRYLAVRNIYSLSYYPKIKILAKNRGNFFYRNILNLKNKLKILIKGNFTEPQATVAAAIFLGLKHQIPQELRANFSLTGLSHLLAVSGLHIVTIIAILSFILIEIFYISRRKIFYLLLPIIIIYIVLVGLPASAVRAAIMAFVYIYGQKIGRRKDQLNLLVGTAWLMLLVNPKLLIGDIGFQLSFLSVLGIYWLYPDFDKILAKVPNKKYFPLRSYLSITLSAQIFTFPLILYYFGNLSLIAPMANLFILPVVPLLMIFIFIFSFMALIFSWLAKILVWPAWVILTYILIMVKFFAHLPCLSFSFGSVSIGLVIFLYLAIILLKILFQEKEWFLD